MTKRTTTVVNLAGRKRKEPITSSNPANNKNSIETCIYYHMHPRMRQVLQNFSRKTQHNIHPRVIIKFLIKMLEEFWRNNLARFMSNPACHYMQDVVMLTSSEQITPHNTTERRYTYHKKDRWKCYATRASYVLLEPFVNVVWLFVEWKSWRLSGNNRIEVHTL